jgi:hypothetical protein
VITEEQIIEVIRQVEDDENLASIYGNYNISFKADIASAILDKIKAEADYKPCDNSGFKRNTPEIEKGKKELEILRKDR